MPDTEYDYYGLPQEQAAAKAAARIAALKQQNALGVLGMLSGDRALGAVGNQVADQAFGQERDISRMSGSVLEKTLSKQQRDIANKHAADELERQKAADEVHAMLAKAQAAHLYAVTKKAREPEPKLSILPGMVDAEGRPMLYNPKDPTQAAIPVAGDFSQKQKEIPAAYGGRIAAAATGAEMLKVVQDAYRKAQKEDTTTAWDQYYQTRMANAPQIANGVSPTGRASEPDKKHVLDLLPGKGRSLLKSTLGIGDPEAGIQALMEETRARHQGAIEELGPGYNTKGAIARHEKIYGVTPGAVPAAGGPPGQPEAPAAPGPTKVVGGKTYEKRPDGKWYPL